MEIKLDFFFFVPSKIFTAISMHCASALRKSLARLANLVEAHNSVTVNVCVFFPIRELTMFHGLIPP